MPQPITSLTLTGQPPHAVGTGQTGGWLLQAPAAFFRRLFRKQKETHSALKKPTHARTNDDIANLLKPQHWTVTWQNSSGDVQNSLVSISGYWKLSSLEQEARRALFSQHEIENANIIRLSLWLGSYPAHLERAQRANKDIARRLRFEEGCG